MRVTQPEGARGSLKWIQRAVNDCPFVLDRPVLAAIPEARRIEWMSPLRSDYAEYRDASVLRILGLAALVPHLETFWPARGPQWDALGKTDRHQVVLLEAKAHIGEMLTPGTRASPQSLGKIEKALLETIQAMKAVPKAPWTIAFYQLANRFAALHFLVSHGVDAYLVLANFVGDAEMAGPETEAEWRTAYLAAYYTMGVSERHPYAGRVIHIYPRVAEL